MRVISYMRCPSSSVGKEGQKRPTTKVTIRPARNIWDKDIAAFGLSNAAIQHLRSHGINQIQDLYENSLGKDPGWFAVRGLFKQVARGRA